ncbi:MAG: YaeQ family protein [Desulfuromonadaceae bacterium]
MALPSTIYRVTIQLSDIDRGMYETLQATVARHPSETEERLVARLLAFALFYEPDLVFAKGLAAGDEPDLWLKRPDDRVQLWVEVGLPESDRLIKASRHAERVALIACGRTLAMWEQQHLPKLANIANLTVIRFEQAFINSLVSTLDRCINWSVTVNDGNLYINVGAETLEAVI